jgi:nitrite reductase/ring-hydroxylating ferredoxin subunit
MSEAAAEGAQDPVWEKVLDPDELPVGRVRPVTCHLATVCMTRFEGEYAALHNKCPHQGRPLGEGSIENGWLRCPWHGWDFHPITGRSPGSLDGQLGHQARVGHGRTFESRPR